MSPKEHAEWKNEIKKNKTTTIINYINNNNKMMNDNYNSSKSNG